MQRVPTLQQRLGRFGWIFPGQGRFVRMPHVQIASEVYKIAGDVYFHEFNVKSLVCFIKSIK